MVTRLVSFLGLGRRDAAPPYYREVCYRWDGRESTRTPLVARALVELMEPKIDEVVILGTTEVEERFVSSGVLAEHLGDVAWRFVRIPAGRAAPELARILEAAVEAMGMVDPPQSLVVDLTLGFRVQPIVGASAVAFALSEWARTGRRAPALRIVYGAADDGAPGAPAEIWDITDVLTVHRWNAALDATVRFGRADDLEELARSVTSTDTTRARQEGIQGAELGPFAHAHNLGKAARKFADAVALGRAATLFKVAAPELQRVVADPNTEVLVAHMPVLRGALGELGRAAGLLGASDVLGKSGLRAMVRLAEYCGRVERFAEQATALREAATTLYALATDRPPSPEPGTPNCRTTRDEIDESLGASLRALDGRAATGIRARAIKFYGAIHEPRNDIGHLGLNDGPSSSNNLRKRLKALTEELRSIVDQFDTEESS